MSIITSTAPVSTSFRRTLASSRPALEACDDMTTPARPVLVEVAVEIGEPQVVGVRDLLRLVDAGQAEGQALVALDLPGVHFVHVERRIGHDEVALAGQLVRVLVVGDGFVPGPDGALQTMNGEVDLG